MFQSLYSVLFASYVEGLTISIKYMGVNSYSTAIDEEKMKNFFIDTTTVINETIGYLFKKVENLSFNREGFIMEHGAKFIAAFQYGVCGNYKECETELADTLKQTKFRLN